MQKKEYSVEVAGKTLTAEFNDLADQTNGSVMLKYGNTVILATAVMGKNLKDGDFFPLTVDFEEKFYASGKISGSRFMKREGKPSDDSILRGRIIDRTIRPLFDQHLRYEVQVVITVLAVDEYDPDVLGVTAASLALGTSDIPWNGPVSCVRVGKVPANSDFILNPSYLTRANDLEMELVACGKDKNINMIEFAGKEAHETTTVEMLNKASEEIEKIQAFQQKVIAEIGKTKKVIDFPKISDEAVALFKKEIEPKLFDEVFSGPGNKQINDLKEEWGKLYETTFPEDKKALADDLFEEEVNGLIHREAIANQKRPDGRKTDEIRPLFVQAGGISPVLHGCGIFYRGGTHVLSVLTLGGPKDSQVINGGMDSQEDTFKRFMHHYNFPPYSSGETGRMGGTNRRMIGHGALAEKALFQVIPSKEEFPYTIRLVSESMASNGSTSMGSVCASTMALMDGGVPIKAPVAGIASGLMMETHEKYQLLTDIQGPEDHHGDMDFKVAGTEKGITAIQMDVKVDSIPIKILAEALEKAKKARLEIIEKIKKEISEPRKDISERAPKILITKIKQDQIGMIIGPQGKNIKEIKEKTGAEIDIDDDGTIYITGKNGAADKAKAIIEEMTRVYKAGDKFEGVVTKIMEFGAFVKIGSNTEGLVHISEIAPFRVDRVEKYLKEGQKIPVVIKEIDERDRISLSIKKIDPNFVKEIK
ncbi:MAG: polyribonucleotide nucleotidyltransferase [Candidatus Paceibacterota bacterium]